MKPNRPTARSAATRAPECWPWLELPAVDMGLRVGRVALMATAAVIVLSYLILYLGGMTEAEKAQLLSAPCFESGC
jgi:hypothetical protein